VPTVRGIEITYYFRKIRGPRAPTKRYAVFVRSLAEQKARKNDTERAKESEDDSNKSNISGREIKECFVYDALLFSCFLFEDTNKE